jgi:hypothetical protein
VHQFDGRRGGVMPVTSRVDVTSEKAHFQGRSDLFQFLFHELYATAGWDFRKGHGGLERIGHRPRAVPAKV